MIKTINNKETLIKELKKVLGIVDEEIKNNLSFINTSIHKYEDNSNGPAVSPTDPTPYGHKQRTYDKEDFNAIPNEIIINTKTGKTTLIFKIDNHRYIETTIVDKTDTFNKETGVIVALLKKNIKCNKTYQAIINKAYNFKTPTMTNAYLQGVLNTILLQNDGISIRQVDKLLNAVKELQPGENNTLEFNIYYDVTVNTRIEIR